MKIVLGLLLASSLTATPKTQDVSAITPFLESYCVSCHNQTRKVGGLMLDRINTRDVSIDAEVWEKVVRELRAVTMPMPAARIRPDAATTRNAIATITSALDRTSARVERVDNRQVVERLAKMLWDTAADRELHNARSIQPQVRRMLRDPKSAAFIQGFLNAFLGFETPVFVERQIRDDRPIAEMWTANGAGILGSPMFLKATSMPDRASPTARGAWLLDRFFGVGSPTPPPNLPPIHFSPGSIRKELDHAYSEPRCAGCHYIGVLGYGLENYDQVGRWRAADASGTMPDGTPFSSVESFRAELMKRLDAFLYHLTEKLLAYGTDRRIAGRQISYWEMPDVRAAVKDAAAKNYRWSALIAALANTASFQSRPPLPAPASAVGRDFSGAWVAPNGQPIGITQPEVALQVPRVGGRVWTYHLNRWGNRYEGSDKLVQARWDNGKLIVVAAPGLRAGTVLEMWSLSADGNELVCESIQMTAVPLSFDFREASISAAYSRNKTTYKREFDERTIKRRSKTR